MAAASGSSTGRAVGAVDVVLVVMPFADVHRPALGVSLLKTAAERAGFSVVIEYCNLRLAELIGADVYGRIANDFPPDLLVGEWVFADDLFGLDLPPEEDYVERLLVPFAGETTARHLAGVRRRVAAYLDECTARVSRRTTRALVGFTSTFHQNCAGLGVARRLKAGERPPTIVFGGANCEAEMGAQLLRSFASVDFVCSGEADRSFVQLLEHVLGGAPGSIPGVLCRDGDRGPPGQPIEDMDALPIPDFDEYFRQIGASGLDVTPQLTFETARGCWWGARRHCTFCGLNGATMAFRSKSPERAYDEIVHLCRRHSTTKLSCVDNILDPMYADTLFPRLARSGLDLEIFYEVKANLHHDQLQRMRSGGIRSIQPGIESLSDEVLRLMRKGVTAFQNIQLLRWCRELGHRRRVEHPRRVPRRVADGVRADGGVHPVARPPPAPVLLRPAAPRPLQPVPHRAGRVRLPPGPPARAYYYVYPFGRRELTELAYFFDFDYGDDRDVAAYIEPVMAAVQTWWDGWTREDRPVLEARFDADRVVVRDTRPVARAETLELRGLAARLLRECDRTTTLTALRRSPELACEDDELIATVDALVRDGLLARTGGQLVSLAVVLDRPPDHQPGTRSDADEPGQTARPEALLTVGRPAGRAR